MRRFEPEPLSNHHHQARHRRRWWWQRQGSTPTAAARGRHRRRRSVAVRDSARRRRRRNLTEEQLASDAPSFETAITDSELAKTAGTELGNESETFVALEGQRGTGDPSAATSPAVRLRTRIMAISSCHQWWSQSACDSDSDKQAESRFSQLRCDVKRKSSNGPTSLIGKKLL